MFFLTVLSLLGIYAILALSLNLITGVAGQVSLGHAAFFGTGAYTLAVLTKADVPYALALIGAMLAAGVVGLLLGAISLRLKADHLAIASIAMNFVAVAVFLYVPIFGGAYGLSSIAKPGGQVGTLVMVALALLFTAALHERIRHSVMGLALGGLRESEDAAAALGVDVRRYKVTAFTLGCALAGLGGALYASHIGVINPQDFSFPLSVTFMAMVAVGGMGTFAGPLLGAILLGSFAQVFSFAQNYQLILYGLLLTLVMRYHPQGILGRRL